MAKQSEKVAADKQPQRGKSRFGPQQQPRPARVVLPDRPPREIDNEIVSILLGGDPRALGAESSGETAAAPAPVAPAPPAVKHPEESPSAETLPEAETPPAELAEVLRPAVAVPTRRPRLTPSKSPTSPTLERVIPPAGIEAAPRPAGPETSTSAASLPASGPGAEGIAISSFVEFAERWRHGLRKGQMKVCEVLYQKTYALGRIECVTSFAELGRLSGLKMRQCFNIIAQLEALRFIERAKADATSNKKDQGSIIRFYLIPRG